MQRRDGFHGSWVLASLVLALLSTWPFAARAQGPAQALRIDASAPTSTTNADGYWFELTIGPRQRHSAILDPIQHRMIVFGGLRTPSEPSSAKTAYFMSDVWELLLDGSMLWYKRSPAGTAPSARYGHSAVYDPLRQRMLVWGGLSASGGDATVYALSLAGAPTWSVLTAAGSPPVGRYGHTAIYDPARDRMLVFGGRESGSNRNDVWALSLSGSPAWTLLTPSGSAPGVRQRHSAVYDAPRDRMIVFGGRGAGTLNDVWALSLAGTPAWSALAAAGTPPSARSDHAAVYDLTGDRMVVFGGGGLADVWTLALAGTPTWSMASPAGTLPVGRSGHSAVLDADLGRVVTFAGVGTTSGDVVSDVQLLSLAGSMQWVANLFDRPGPGPRYGHGSIVDPVRHRLLVYGGWNNAGSTPPATVWSLSLTGQRYWTDLVTTGTPPPAGLTEMSVVYDPLRDRMLVFGGVASDFVGQTWALSLADPPAWTELTPTGTPPSGRMGHVAIYDPVRDRMLVHGGTGATTTNDVWSLSLSGTPAWTPLAPTGTPPAAEYDHAAVYDPLGDRMLRLGGWPGSSTSVFALSLAPTPAWSSVTTTGIPSSGYGRGAIYDAVRQRLVAVGGRTVMSTGEQAGLKALTLTALPAWGTPSPDGGPPHGRAQHTVAYDPSNDGMLVFGGQPDGSTIGNPILGDVWIWAFDDPLIVPPPIEPTLRQYIAVAAPNPTHGDVAIAYQLAAPGRIRADVYDVTGRHLRTVADAWRAAGAGAIRWDGEDDAGVRQSPGLYWVRIQLPDLRTTRRVVLSR